MSVNEEKFLEIVGDPDSGLHLEKGFKENLERRLRNVPWKVLHDEVLKKYGIMYVTGKGRHPKLYDPETMK